ncbi:MAG: hypothetical protein MUC42_15795 [Bryobacter sp.]|jgi:hypothetical protein|nr:hypothetical protein [Bryobacter sp.]
MNSGNRLIAAIRGPLMLMTLGGLFAFDHFGTNLPFRSTWPVLVIMYGLLRLAESLFGPKEELANPTGGVS